MGSQRQNTKTKAKRAVRRSEVICSSVITLRRPSRLWKCFFLSDFKKTISFFCYLTFRIASLSKIFPTLMLYRLWEDGKIGSLDDPLEKYVENFTIKNPLGRSRDSELKYVTDGLIFLDSGEVQIRSSSVTLRRMASQLSGTKTRGLLWTNLRATITILILISHRLLSLRFTAR